MIQCDSVVLVMPRRRSAIRRCYETFSEWGRGQTGSSADDSESEEHDGEMLKIMPTKRITEDTQIRIDETEKDKADIHGRIETLTK